MTQQITRERKGDRNPFRRLRVVTDDMPEDRVFGSPGFLRLTRNPGLRSPTKYEPTVKGENDVII